MSRYYAGDFDQTDEVQHEQTSQDCSGMALAIGARCRLHRRRKTQTAAGAHRARRAPPFVHAFDKIAKRGPAIKEFKLVIEEKKVVIDDKGTTFQAMTYNGSMPLPAVGGPSGRLC